MGKYGVKSIDEKTKEMTDFLVLMCGQNTPWGPVAQAQVQVVVAPVARQLVNDYSLDCANKDDWSAIEAGCEELLLSYSFYPPQGKLGFSKPCITAFEKALEICPTFEVKHEASLRAIVQAVNADKASEYRGASFQDSSYLAKLFEVMGERGQLYRTPQGEAEELKLKAQAADEVERGQLIAKILDGKSTYPIFAYGQTKAASGDHLPKESTERLREILAEVTRVRAMKVETREQQRERVHNAVVQAGHVDQPKRDSLDGVVGGSGATAAQPTTNLYGHGLFENPATGATYTKAEVMAMPKTAKGRELFRKLMASDLNFLNEIVSGKHDA